MEGDSKNEQAPAPNEVSIDENDVKEAVESDSRTRSENGNKIFAENSGTVAVNEDLSQNEIVSKRQQSSDTLSQSQSQPQQSAANSQEPGSNKPKKKKKGLIMALVIVGALALLGGGSAAAYNLWYQNPDKVLRDGLTNVVAGFKSDSGMKLNTVVNYSDDNLDMNIDVVTSAVNSKSTSKVNFSADANIDGVAINIDMGVDVVTSTQEKGSTTYFKLSNLKESVHKAVDKVLEQQMKQNPSMNYYSDSEKQQLFSMVQKQLYQSIDPILEKVDGRWIKVDADSADDSDNEQLSCLMDVFESLQDDKEVRQGLADAYEKHKFILVEKELGAKDGSLGYELKFDNVEAKKFGQATESSEFVKKVKDCDKDTDTPSGLTSDDAGSEDDAPNVKKFEIWVSRWTHKITELDVVVESDSITDNTMFGAKKKGELTLKLKLDYSEVDPIEVPKDAVDIKDINLTGGDDTPAGLIPNLL